MFMAPVMREHILHSFESALRALHDNVLLMASLTERNLQNTFTALFERDNELANQAIADDEEIDTLEKQVDQARPWRCSRTVSKRSPTPTRNWR